MPLIEAKSKRAYSLALLLLIISFNSLISTSVNADSTIEVTIFANLGCSSCREHADELKAALNETGITNFTVRDLSSDQTAQSDLDNLEQNLGVPADMRVHNVVVSVNDKFLFEGYIPVEIITDFLANHINEYNKIVVSYLGYECNIMTEDGRSPTCYIIPHTGMNWNSIEGCIQKPENSSIPLSQRLLLIVGSGLLDGINPCAFAVLFFFTAILLMHFRKERKTVLLVGSIYIIAVFLAYLTIGLIFHGIMQRVGFPHLVTAIGALLVIVLGVVNIKDYFWPGKGFSLGIPKPLWSIIRTWMRKFTIPAVFVVGLMVGFFEFPCTGGIYLGIISLLVQETFVQGFIFLLLYNLMFILPLIVILAFMSNKRIINFSLEKWQQHEQKTLRLFSGLFMIALGVLLLFWALT